MAPSVHQLTLPGFGLCSACSARTSRAAHTSFAPEARIGPFGTAAALDPGFPGQAIAGSSGPRREPGVAEHSFNRRRRNGAAFPVADERRSPHPAIPAAVGASLQLLTHCKRAGIRVRSTGATPGFLARPTGGGAAGTDRRAPARGFHMYLSEIFSGVGLALDIIGFAILFGLALPVVMRRSFVASDRVGLDGVEADPGQAERLMDPGGARLLERRRRRRQTCWYWAGGSAVLLGFALQFVALFVP